MSKFKVGDAVRLNAEFRPYQDDPNTPHPGDVVTVTSIEEPGMEHWFEHKGSDYGFLPHEADAVSPADWGVKPDDPAFEKVWDAYGDGVQVGRLDGLKEQADEIAAYREFYEFVVSIDGIAELAEGLEADDDLEGWAAFSALVDRIREMRGEG